MELASGAFQLRVENPAGLEPRLLQGLVNCWKHSYERMAGRFNAAAPRKVWLRVLAGMAHPGETLGAEIRISADWIRKHPYDLDVMTHEQFHVVQNYGPGAEPGWAVEGLADYARWKYGLSNLEWSLPALRPEHHWTDSYRVTAAFFGWLEERRLKEFPEQLDQALRRRAYDRTFWNLTLGSSLEKLWGEYQRG
ncbi:hypothetical protein JST97_32860 [bacterium]|nr:hypothetical protein [bacterium]